MLAYALRRLLLIVPTLLGILALNFAIVQVAPGGPVETMIARLQGTGGDPTARVSGDRGGDVAQARGAPDSGAPTRYRGARGLDPRLIASDALVELEQDQMAYHAAALLTGTSPVS